MPIYTMFMKDLVTKKKTVSFERTDNVHHCSATTTRSLVEKNKDLKAFTILCTIRSFNITRELCDLGSIINLILLVIYMQLGLEAPKPTSMRLLMADHIVKKPIDILCDVLVKVACFIFFVDFVIMDYKVDFEVYIILGRTFLAMGRALVDIEMGQMKFRLNGKKFTFNICQSM